DPVTPTAALRAPCPTRPTHGPVARPVWTSPAATLRRDVARNPHLPGRPQAEPGTRGSGHRRGVRGRESFAHLLFHEPYCGSWGHLDGQAHQPGVRADVD